MEKVKCDCLNYCGDDPWLAQGKAEPCEARKKRALEAQQRAKEQTTPEEVRDRLNGIASLGLDYIQVKSEDVLLLCKALE